MNLKLKYFAVVAFLILSVSQGVIRVGTGGGGLAEIQVVYIHQNLNQFILVCVQKSNPCQLSATEFSEYRALFERHQYDAQRFQFTFVGGNPSGKVYEHKNGQVAIDSKVLYNSLAEPWEFKKLLAFVLAVRLDLLPSSNSLQDNYKKGLSIFQSLLQSHQFHRASGTDKLFMIHLYEIQFANIRTKKVFVEDELQTYDVSQIVSSNLPCGSLAEWRFQNWRSTFTSQEVYFTANASSRCIGSKGRREPTFVLKANLDRDLQILPGSVRAAIRY